jgi:prepilin-type N-terminal cleavage/methylation domain-containing protein
MARLPFVSKRQEGFTLTELLIVIALIIIILMIILINMRTQIAKGNDIKRKTDLNKIQKVFEEYMNDRACYPDADALDICNGNTLSPYLPRIPCDPVKKTPYLYVSAAQSRCTVYHLCAQLENLADPDIKLLGCDPIEGCGWGVGYNYCIAAGAEVLAPGFVAGGGATGASPPGAGSPSPTQIPIPGMWACTPGGDCNAYADPVGAGCPFTYQTRCVVEGVFQCGNVANRCANF